MTTLTTPTTTTTTDGGGTALRRKHPSRIFFFILGIELHNYSFGCVCVVTCGGTVVYTVHSVWKSVYTRMHKFLIIITKWDIFTPPPPSPPPPQTMQTTCVILVRFNWKAFSVTRTYCAKDIVVHICIDVCHSWFPIVSSRILSPTHILIDACSRCECVCVCVCVRACNNAKLLLFIVFALWHHNTWHQTIQLRTSSTISYSYV